MKLEDCLNTPSIIPGIFYTHLLTNCHKSIQKVVQMAFMGCGLGYYKFTARGQQVGSVYKTALCKMQTRSVTYADPYN